MLNNGISCNKRPVALFNQPQTAKVKAIHPSDWVKPSLLNPALYPVPLWWKVKELSIYRHLKRQLEKDQTASNISDFHRGGGIDDFIMRGDQLSGQWRILRQLEVSKYGLTAATIAEMSGISLRTAYRDLDDLQLAGFPIYPEKREGCQCWKFVDTYKSNLPFPFVYTELMSLHMSRDLFKVFKGTVFFESLDSFFNTDEIKQWVLGLGSEACVVEPEELRRLVQLELRSALRQYEDGNLFQKEKVEAISTGTENAIRKTHL